MGFHAASTQVTVLSLVFFCCPGLFNALSSIASGLQDATIAFRGNVLIYSFFTVASAMAAALLPTLGARRSLVVGTLGYVVYVVSLWKLSTVQTPSPGAATILFYVASGMLGVSAGFLWISQGQMVMSYATERNQGRYLSTFWIIFNLGATFGGVLTCGLNWSQSNARVVASDTTFAAFVVVTAVGTVLAIAGIVSLHNVVKEDGSRVVVAVSSSRSSWREDAKALLTYATTSRDVARLLPFFVYSNWFYTYHAFFNVATFNTRTSGLASAAYWTAQMLAALGLGRWLDRSTSPSRTAVMTLTMLAVVWNLMWTIGCVTQYTLSLSYDRPQALDIGSGRVLAPLVLYTIYGAGDALGQVWIYWYLSSVCANGRDLRTAGFNAGIYKSIQALSAAVAWAIGAQRVAPTTQLWTNWVLCNAALVGAAWSVRHKRDDRSIALRVYDNKNQQYLSTHNER